MAHDTTAPSYWLNWRFFLCAVWVLATIIAAAVIIMKFEGSKKVETRRRDNQHETIGSLYEDEAWGTSLKVIHPGWLLVYRLMAFSLLLALLVANAVIDGGGIFYFYTQWTFVLVTIYFGLGSSISIYGCCQQNNEVGGERIDCVVSDPEQVACTAPTLGGNANAANIPISINTYTEPHVHKSAGIWGYIFQIIFQISTGAVILTDIVFWIVLYRSDRRLDFLIVCMHSVNAVFLVGDVMLNCLRFPFFRIAYFVLWTCIFVIFQWIIHACISMWWPYQFLDLSSPYAPIWYLLGGILHLPCYCIFTLIFRAKQFCLSRLCQDHTGG